MPSLFRVLPHLRSARRGQPGHPLYVPRSTGASRVDNPGLYDVLYLADTAAGAIAEAFGWSPTWHVGLFRGPPTLPGSVRALVEYDVPATHAICDLDDAARLVSLALKPSQVVTKDRGVTQAWAATVFNQDRYAGVRWWSYYDPRWGSYGLWQLDGVRVRRVTPLEDLDHPDVVQAADVLCRRRV